MVMTEDVERFLTVEQVAERLQVPQDTVRRWLRERRLIGARLGGRKSGWRIRETALDRFIAEAEGREGPEQ
jgi:excisionase family DNA binding protein